MTVVAVSHHIAFLLRKRWAIAPRSMAVVALAAAGLCAAFAIHLNSTANLDTKRMELARLLRTGAGNVISPLASSRALQLPAFSGQHLVGALHEAGRKHGVPIGAVNYTFDEGGRRPYLRYRASFAIETSYANLRKVIAEILGTSSYIALDSVACARPETPGPFIYCDIAVSAFYAKAGDA